MHNLHLRSDMKNCTAFGNGFTWDFPVLELDRDTEVALSSLTIDFKSKPSNNKPIRVTLSLIEGDIFNPDGTIICFPSKTKDVSHFASNLEFWPNSVRRPRIVRITIPNHTTDSILFLSTVLVIKK